MVNSRTEYSERATEAARRVMLELIRVLGEYKDDLVLVGGWVPELLFSKAIPRHVGSIDVDLALNHLTIDDVRYRTILEHLAKHGYREGKQPFIFLRTVEVEGQSIDVQVDLLAGEYGGDSRKHRHQSIQEIKARKARGCDLAFEMTESITLEGTLPEGGKDSVVIRVAGIVPFLIMKAMALADRMKNKDAWDIYFCLRNYPGGNEALAEVFRPHLGNKLVLEGLEKIHAKFATPEHVGPIWCADFDEIADAEDRAVRIRDAFERVNDLLQRLGIITPESE
jgi:hypothetical protein